MDFSVEREAMVEHQIKARGVKDPATLRAMREVPRHLFVEKSNQPFAYEDGPLAIGHGQTISQPYIVAVMTEAAELTPDSVVLDVGTGSGYAAAILSRIVKEVYSIERIPELTQAAQKVIQELGYTNIHLMTGDGTLGWKEKAPFDAIIVTAGAPVVPESFAEQLKVGGRIIIPVGDSIFQELLRLRKNPNGTLLKENLESVRFVPLIGKEGWSKKP